MNASLTFTGPANSHKMLCFEAIRGLAAFAVLVGHYLVGFWPAVIFREGLGWNEIPAVLRVLARFPGKFLWDGHLAVSIFFVLSGFVLSLIYFQKGSVSALGSAALRRYPRLMLPVAASVLVAFLLLLTGAILNQAAVRHMNEIYGLPMEINYNAANGFSNKWLANFYRMTPHLPTALYEATWGAFSGIASYNLVLWTMPIELTGSFLVYGFLALFGSLRNRWLIYAIGAAILLVNQNFFMLDFFMGMALCDLWVQNQRTWRRTLSLSPALVLVGVALFLLPWKPVAALLIVGATAVTPRLQYLLSGRWLAFLGKLSFTLYLIHMPIFCSLGCGLYVVLCQGLGWQHVTGSLTAMLASTIASFLAAWALYVWVDRPAIALTRRLDSWLFRPKVDAGAPDQVVTVPEAKAA